MKVIPTLMGIASCVALGAQAHADDFVFSVAVKISGRHSPWQTANGEISRWAKFA